MVQQVMTKPEAIVYRWLLKNDIAFTFQSSMMGGRFSLGGAVVDFVLTELRIGLRVQGRYWHEGVNKKAMDDIQRENLEAEGLIIVDIWDDDLETPSEVEATMQLAIQGREVLH